MIRKTVVLLALAVAPSLMLCAGAHAQLGVYGTVTVNRLGVTPYPTYDINGPAVKSSVGPVGGTLGAYYDFKTLGPVRLGVDLRGIDLTSKDQGIAYSEGSGTRVYSALGGVRASFHTPISVLRPYLQGSAGLGRVYRGRYDNGLEYEVFAGLDLHLLPFLDFRAVELGIGGLHASNTTSLRSLSSGIVFRLP